VVVHSLLRFVPREAHADVLRRFGGWLRRHGRIVLSCRLENDAGTSIFEADQRHFGEDIRRRIRDGQLKVGESAESFAVQLNRRSTEEIASYGNLASLRALFERAEMPVLAHEIVQGEVRRSGKTFMRRRVIFVLGAPQT
jgi:hypothetical protein